MPRCLFAVVLSLLCTVSVFGAKPAGVPGQAVVIPGLDEEAMRSRLLATDMQPLEGIWQYPNEQMTLGIERRDDADGYRIIVLASEDIDLLPGTVIGYIEGSAVDSKYHLWLYSERNQTTLCGPLECVATLSADGSTFTFDPPHWRVKVRVNFARFLPSLFRGISITPDKEEEHLPIGFHKVFPEGEGNKFNKVRYL